MLQKKSSRCKIIILFSFGLCIFVNISGTSAMASSSVQPIDPWWSILWKIVKPIINPVINGSLQLIKPAKETITINSSKGTTTIKTTFGPGTTTTVNYATGVKKVDNKVGLVDLNFSGSAFATAELDQTSEQTTLAE